MAAIMPKVNEKTVGKNWQDRQIDKQKDRQTDRQTDRETSR